MKSSWMIIGLLTSTVAIFGCQNHPVAAEDATSNDVGETGEGSCQPYEPCSECWIPQLPQRTLDILLIVDGSIGSAGAQERLSAGLEQLLAELDATEHGIDYRIAITTTDMGPPACDPSSTTPEYGRFIGTSCRERLADFVDADGQDFSSSCTDMCSLELIERLPTTIAQEPEPAVRSWIERDGEQSNLSIGVDPLEALRCMAMVGVAGCRFESPLAAIEAAYLGTQTPGHPNYGFFRPMSRRAFLIVSDASECSWSEVGAAIFDPEGTRAFWSDPQADAPTPAVCWNAGTECTLPGGELTCKTGTYNLDGEDAELPGEAVLRPARDFVDLLRDSESWSNDIVLFTGLTLEGEVAFEYAQDPDFALEHGIGPGCDDQAGSVALPPVRMWDFLRAFQDLNDLQQYYVNHSESICAPDFGPTLAALGQRERESIDRPNCYYAQPCDNDPSTELLDVDCEVVAYSWAIGEPFDVPECARGDDGAYLVDPDTGRAAMPDAETDLCYLARVDAQQLTPDPLDDAWPDCIEYEEGGYRPLGFDIVTRDGRIPDEYIEATCTDN